MLQGLSKRLPAATTISLAISLKKFSTGDRDFLLQTSILDRLTAGLCDGVTGGQDSQEILNMLQEANFFLIPLDHQRIWYRYHYLFAEFLRRRLQETLPDLIPELHRRASEWYEIAGLTEDAIAHAFTAADYGRAGRLIKRVAPIVVIHNDSPKTFLRWTNKLPDGFLLKDPHLCIYQGWALVIIDQLEEAEQFLGHAEAHDDAASQMVFSPHVTALKARIARAKQDFPRAVALWQQTLRQLGDGKIEAGFGEDEIQFIRVLAMNGLAYAFRLSGQLEDADRTYSRSINLNQGSRNIGFTLNAIGSRGRIKYSQGQLHQAERILSQGLYLMQSTLDEDKPGVQHHLLDFEVQWL